MQLLSLLFVALALVSSHGAFGAPPNSHDAIHRRHREHHCKNNSSFNVDIVKVKHKISNSVSTASLAPASAPSPAGNQCDVLPADQATILKLHHELRAHHNASALAWNNTLCAFAQDWTKGCDFKHSVVDFGQNLAAGTGDYSFTSAFDAWAAEEKDYNNVTQIYSHYTQLVWKNTLTVGCAKYHCAPGGSGDPFPGIPDSWDYWVCDYYPPGNVEGEFPQNVV